MSDDEPVRYVGEIAARSLTVFRRRKRPPLFTPAAVPASMAETVDLEIAIYAAPGGRVRAAWDDVDGVLYVCEPRGERHRAMLTLAARLAAAVARASRYRRPISP